MPAALDSMLAGAAVKTAQTDVAGCAIKMPERDRRQAHAQISYEKTIAPLLIDKCVSCHRDGGIGPWQMANYDMIKGFAPMIREVVRTQRMPPWNADPHYSAFSNDRGLSTEQARTLVHWIEAGAPRGTGADPLLSQKKDWPQWPLGKPDLIVELPSFTVPATGTIPYQMTRVENPLDHDVWVRAIDWVPGERSAVHHIIASAGGAERKRRGEPQQLRAGRRAARAAAGSGILLPAHATFHFQTHYTSNGKQLTIQTKMGLYFRKDPPKYNFRSLVFANNKLHIPANTKWHEEGRRAHAQGGRDHLHAASACALSRQGVALRRVLPGRQDTDAAEHPRLRLQLAGHVRADQADAGAGGHAHRVLAVVRQLHAEQGEPRREPRGDLGRADLGRDDLRRDPLSQRHRRRAGAAERKSRRRKSCSRRGRRSSSWPRLPRPTLQDESELRRRGTRNGSSVAP